MSDKTWDRQQEADGFDQTEHLLSEMTGITRLGKNRAPKSALAIRMDADDIDRLRRRAEAEGMGLTQLARSWILERLDEPEESQTVEALIETLNEGLRAARALRRVMPQ